MDHSRLAACETLQDIEESLMALLTFPTKEAQTDYGTYTPGRSSSTASVSHCSSRSSLTQNAKENPIALHISASNATPLCLFHDGSGLVQMYAKLQGFDRSTYGFFDPHFLDSAPPFSSLVQMATQYALKLSVSAMPAVILCGMPCLLFTCCSLLTMARMVLWRRRCI